MTSKNGKRTFWTWMTDIAGTAENHTPVEAVIPFMVRVYGFCWSRIQNPFYNGSYWTSRS